MSPAYEKALLSLGILVLSVGYFIASWFLMDYGIKQGDLKLITAPLVGFMSIVVAAIIMFSIKKIFCPRPEYFNSLGDQQW
jgi:ABC-type uncharacterized transport system permease subunit